MKLKSDENFDSAYKLIKVHKFPNAGASRLYYSVFQSIQGYSNKIGHSPKNINGQKETKHVQMARLLLEMKTRDNSLTKFYELFKQLIGCRVTADYKSESVRHGIIDGYIDDADKMRKYFITKSNEE